jgi:glycosyltransferase involved in cell wall biosynthesis
VNILLLNWQDRLNPLAGGAETHAHEIFSRVAAAGHRVTLYCSAFEGAKPLEMVDGMEVIREGKRNTFNLTLLRRYHADLRHRAFDIVIDDINKIPFFTPLYVRKPLLGIAHHLFGKSIFTEAGVVAGSYVYAAEACIAPVYRQTPFAVVSESTRDEFITKGFSPNALTVIPNCIDHAQFPFRVGKKAAHPVITYFGRLKTYKSVHHAIEAFAQLVNDFPTAELRILGKGDAEPDLRLLTKRLGITAQVKFMGFIAEADKARLLSEAHCVVNPSMKEGWGIINIEANACGTPVVAANVPGLRDAVRHGESGLLYEYGDIEALTAILRMLLSDAPLLERLSEGACRFAQEFDWDVSARAMVRLMEGTIKQYHQKRHQSIHF